MSEWPWPRPWWSWSCSRFHSLPCLSFPFLSFFLSSCLSSPLFPLFPLFHPFSPFFTLFLPFSPFSPLSTLSPFLPSSPLFTFFPFFPSFFHFPLFLPFSFFFFLFLFLFLSFSFSWCPGTLRHAQVQHAQQSVPCLVFLASELCTHCWMAQDFWDRAHLL